MTEHQHSAPRPPGWYPDDRAGGEWRWWDGSAFTDAAGPDEENEATISVAELRRKRLEDAAVPGPVPVPGVTCPGCGATDRAGKWCEKCGTPLAGQTQIPVSAPTPSLPAPLSPPTLPGPPAPLLPSLAVVSSAVLAPPPAPPVSATLPVSALAAGQILVELGDVAVTQASIITPNGAYPLAGSIWIVTDNTVETESVSTVGIILAIVFFLACLLGLLFLLMKHKKLTGSVQVMVQGHGYYHATQLPPGSGPVVQQKVAYIRNLVAAIG